MAELMVYLDAVRARVARVEHRSWDLRAEWNAEKMRYEVLDQGGVVAKTLIDHDGVLAHFIAHAPTDLARLEKLVRVAQEVVIAVERVQFGYAGDVGNTVSGWEAVQDAIARWQQEVQEVERNATTC